MLKKIYRILEVWLWSLKSLRGEKQGIQMTYSLLYHFPSLSSTLVLFSFWLLQAGTLKPRMRHQINKFKDNVTIKGQLESPSLPLLRYLEGEKKYSLELDLGTEKLQSMNAFWLG